MWEVSKIVERLKICRTRVWLCCRSDLFIGQKCNKYFPLLHHCFNSLSASVPLSKVNLQFEDSLAQHHVTSSSSGSVVVQQGGANHQHHRLATRWPPKQPNHPHLLPFPFIWNLQQWVWSAKVDRMYLKVPTTSAGPLSSAGVPCNELSKHFPEIEIWAKNITPFTFVVKRGEILIYSHLVPFCPYGVFAVVSWMREGSGIISTAGALVVVTV